MQTKLKNGKLVCTLVLFLLLCTALLIGEGKGRRTNNDNSGEVSATPTPEIPQILSNIWMVEASGQSMTVLLGGEEKKFSLASALPAPLKECIVDITVDKGVVTALTVQQDTIEAKVLRICEDFV